ncbi:MAG: hypothetical protein HC831_17780 [Chloroflexia bacterium]|nr:hypothetical protein [Chloroflexia bacterium]
MSLHNDKPHRFGFLQVRPMVIATGEVDVKEKELKNKDVLVASESVLGNGIINDVQNVVLLNLKSLMATKQCKLPKSLSR